MEHNKTNQAAIPTSASNESHAQHRVLTDTSMGHGYQKLHRQSLLSNNTSSQLSSACVWISEKIIVSHSYFSGWQSVL